jgi:hypothetical protein
MIQRGIISFYFVGFSKYKNRAVLYSIAGFKNIEIWEFHC